MKTITCSEADKMIVTNLDEGLAPERRAILHAHLRECPKCRRLSEQTAEILAALREDIPDDPGKEYWNRLEISLKSRIQGLDERTKRRFRWTKVGFAAAAALVLVLGLRTFMPRSPEYTTRPPSPGMVVEELFLVYGPLSEDSVMVDYAGGQSDDYQDFLYPFDQETFQLIEEEDDPVQLFL